MHHFRKGSGKTRHGQALRGSSECHGWGDSNIYLRRLGERITLAVEHRAAPSAEGIPLRLRPEAFTLEVIDEGVKDDVMSPSVDERICRALDSASAPIAAAALIEACRARRSVFWQALNRLVREGRVLKDGSVYTAAPTIISTANPRGAP